MPSNSNQLWVSLSTALKTSFLSAQSLHHALTLTTAAASAAPLHSENVCSSYDGHRDAATTMGTPSECIPTTKVYTSFPLRVLLGRLKLCSPCSGTRNEEEAPVWKIAGQMEEKDLVSQGLALQSNLCLQMMHVTFDSQFVGKSAQGQRSIILPQ